MIKLSKIIIGVIVLIIIAVLVYVLFFEKAEAPQVININQSVPTDWKTYTDPVSGISLQAPPDFTVASGDKIFADQGSFSLVIPTTTPYVHTHLLHEALVSISVSTSTCSGVVQDAVASSTQVVVNDVPFTRTATGGVGAGNLYQGIDYTTTRNDLCYRVMLFTHSTDGEGFYTNDQTQIQKIDALQAMDIKDLFVLFDQIAGTMKFAK